MTAAELKTLRESLGLTTQWVADQASVQLRTAQYWEKGGRMAVPEDVAAMLTQIDDQFETVATQALVQVEASIAGNGEPEEVVLIRYRNDQDLWRFHPEMKPLPATAHAAQLSRVRRALWGKSIHSMIEYMEPEAYFQWLGKRKDTEAMRSLWAVE